ncbi:hypothetical protein V8F20_000998 [Naviculisporaceae sp. PSN 640]
MSFPTIIYETGSDATHGNGNGNSAAQDRASSATPYSDFVYGQIAPSTQESVPDQNDFYTEEAEEQGGLSELAGPRYANADSMQLIEDDGDADTVVGDPVVGVVEESSSGDSEGPENYGPNFQLVDFAELNARVADPIRQQLLANWRNDLAQLPAGYITQWLREGGPDALANAASPKFEAVVGVPREFLALKIITRPDGTLAIVRDLAHFYRLLLGLWNVKVHTAAVILAHRNRATYAPGGNDRITRRRNLLASGQSYWIHPSPLRQSSVPGADEKGNDNRADPSGSGQDERTSSSSSIMIDEDELVDMYMATYPEEETIPDAGDSQEAMYMATYPEEETIPDAGDSQEAEQLDADNTNGRAAMSSLERLQQAASICGDIFSAIAPQLSDLEFLGGDVVHRSSDDAPRSEVVASDSGAAAAEPLSLEYPDQPAAGTDAYDPWAHWVEGYVTPREVVVDDNVAPLNEAEGDYVTPRLVVVDDDATPSDQGQAQEQAFDTEQEEGRSVSSDQGQVQKQAFGMQEEEGGSVSSTVDEDTTDSLFGGPEYEVVDSVEVADDEVDPNPVESRISEQEDQNSVGSHASDCYYTFESDVPDDVDEQVEDDQPEQFAHNAPETTTPIEARRPAKLAWRLLGDLDDYTNAEFLAVSEPCEIPDEDYGYRVEMEEAQKQQEADWERRGRNGLHHMWIKQPNRINNWAHYWLREQARRMGRYLAYWLAHEEEEREKEKERARQASLKRKREEEEEEDDDDDWSEGHDQDSDSPPPASPRPAKRLRVVLEDSPSPAPVTDSGSEDDLGVVDESESESERTTSPTRKRRRLENDSDDEEEEEEEEERTRPVKRRRIIICPSCRGPCRARRGGKTRPGHH